MNGRHLSEVIYVHVFVRMCVCVCGETDPGVIHEFPAN